MSEKTPAVTIRDAGPMDRVQLRRAVVEIQEYERRLHNSRLPGEQIANAYLAWIENQIREGGGALLIAEIDRCFVDFVAGWIEHSDAVAETGFQSVRLHLRYLRRVRLSWPEDRNSPVVCYRRASSEPRRNQTHSHLFVGRKCIGTQELRAGGLCAI